MIQDNVERIKRTFSPENSDVPSPYSLPNESGTTVINRPFGWPTRPESGVARSMEQPPERPIDTVRFEETEEYRRAYLLYLVRSVREKDGKAAAESVLIEAVRMIDR